MNAFHASKTLLGPEGIGITRTLPNQALFTMGKISKNKRYVNDLFTWLILCKKVTEENKKHLLLTFYLARRSLDTHIGHTLLFWRTTMKKNIRITWTLPNQVFITMGNISKNKKYVNDLFKWLILYKKVTKENKQH